MPNPRLELLVDGEPISSVDLGPLPEPELRSLPARASDLVRAFHVPPGEQVFSPKIVYGQRWDGICVEPRQPLRTGEFWETTIVDTSIARGPQAAISTEDHFNHGVALLYGDDVTAIKIRVARFVRRERSERVAITGLRLVKRGDQTLLDWQDANVKNHLSFDIRLVRSADPYLRNGPRDPTGDYRAPNVELRMSPRRSAFQLGERIDPPMVSADASVAKPLHIQSLTLTLKTNGFDGPTGGMKGIGLNGSKTRPKVYDPPVSVSPFTWSLDVHVRSAVPLGGFEVTIPVEPAPK